MNVFALPPTSRTHRTASHELAARSLVELERRRARGVPPARLPAVARDRAQPGADAAADLARERSKPRRDDPAFLARLRRARSRRSTRARAAHNTWWTQHGSRSSAASRSPTSPPSSRCTSRCRSTPAASACSPAITARKRATSACRSSASASCIRRATSTSSVSADGWQEESYERLNWADAPIEPAITPDGKPCITAVPLGDRTVLVAVWRVRLGRVQAVPARHRSRRERAVGSRAVGAPLRRRSRDAHPAGDHPRHRRRPRAARRSASSPAVFHLNEGHAGVRRAAAHPRSHRAGRVVRRRARGSAADDGLHDAHAGAGRPRRVPVPPGREASRRLLGHARRAPRALPRARRTTTTAAARSST